ncbi:hypothetical protein EHM69_09870 [candidate division KSB1 bacterium]|nr:MAG: hypothetical protein EHM69_09870 [candidate division KSB1 bacterium]
MRWCYLSFFLFAFYTCSFAEDDKASASWGFLGGNLSTSNWIGLTLGVGSDAEMPKWGKYSILGRFMIDYKYKGDIPSAYAGYDKDNSRWWDWGDVELKGSYYDEAWGAGLDFGMPLQPKYLPGVYGVVGLYYAQRTYYDIWWDTTLRKYWGTKDKTKKDFSVEFGAALTYRKTILFLTWDKPRNMTLSIALRR